MYTSYDLDVSGNINFTGTLYQDGVEFSGSSSATNVVKGQVLEKFAGIVDVGHSCRETTYH